MKKAIIIVVLLFLLAGICFVVGYLLPGKEVPAQPKEKITAEVANEEPIITEPVPTEQPPKENSLLDLQKELQVQLETFEGDWAVYVENLSNRDAIEINNQKMISASLIKLFVMGNVFSELERGTVLPEQVTTRLHQMITVSDNEATNELVGILGGGTYTDMEGEAFQKGMEQVNSYSQSLGFSDTELQRDLKNSRSKLIVQQNYTSVVDCGKFLSALYRKELVSEEADTQMMELLKQQTRTGKIPQGLPEGTVCANKTGELSTAENDAAVVFSPGGDYVFCVISNNVSDTAAAREHIVELSRLVYENFN